MKKNLFILALLLCITLGASAQKKFNLYAVGFYNQENLFDTCHDEGKRDYDFLPNGSYKWNGLKYTHKLRNMAQAIADLGTDKLPGIGCAIVGMSEVENSKVLDDLTAQAPLKQRGYKYVHVEGPDRRGIDCAMLYNPWYNLLTKQGKGTLFYNGTWNLFDQIVMTPNLLNANGSKDFSTLKYFQHQIHIRPYLIQSEGRYKGAPKRTTAGGVWLDGYSDHLPVVVYLVKEQK